MAAMHLVRQEQHQSLPAYRHQMALHCLLAAIVLCCCLAECHAVACHMLLERPPGCWAQQRPGANSHFWYIAMWPPIHPVCSSHGTPASDCAGGSWHCRWMCHPCGPAAGEGASAIGAAVRSCAGPGLGELAAVLQQQEIAMSFVTESGSGPCFHIWTGCRELLHTMQPMHSPYLLS